MRGGALHRPTPDAIPYLAARASLHRMTVPKAANWFTFAADGNPVGNDDYGCCVEAYRRRQIEIWHRNAMGDETPASRDAVLADYALEPGFDPKTGVPDAGSDVVTAMTHWATNGIRIDEQNLSIIRWAKIDPANDDHIAIAIAHLGGIGVTLNLPPALLEDPANWPAAPGTGTNWQTTNEYHRVGFGQFDGPERTAITWGMRLLLHPDSWRRYVVAVDAAMSREFLETTGKTPADLDYDALAADLAGMAA